MNTKAGMLALPLLLAASPAPDDTPTTCPRVGVFAAMVAAERNIGMDEEEAGRIAAPKAAHASLRAIVRLVYDTGLDPTAAQILVWTRCDDTTERTR